MYLTNYIFTARPAHAARFWMEVVLRLRVAVVLSLYTTYISTTEYTTKIYKTHNGHKDCTR